MDPATFAYAIFGVVSVYISPLFRSRELYRTRPPGASPQENLSRYRVSKSWFGQVSEYFLIREGVGACEHMKKMQISKAFTLMESGPVVLVTTTDGNKNNIMTISWTMVLDFTPLFAMTTGPWNYSFAALQKTKECVIAIPTVDMLDKVVGVGTCSGADTDKFEEFMLTPVKGRHVKAPLIKECLANIECNVVDIVEKHNIVVLEGIAAYFDTARKEKRTVHAVGDGTFIVDGRTLNRRKMMRAKLPAGL